MLDFMILTWRHFLGFSHLISLHRRISLRGRRVTSLRLVSLCWRLISLWWMLISLWWRGLVTSCLWWHSTVLNLRIGALSSLWSWLLTPIHMPTTTFPSLAATTDHYYNNNHQKHNSSDDNAHYHIYTNNCCLSDACKVNIIVWKENDMLAESC